MVDAASRNAELRCNPGDTKLLGCVGCSIRAHQFATLLWTSAPIYKFWIYAIDSSGRRVGHLGAYNTLLHDSTVSWIGLRAKRVGKLPDKILRCTSPIGGRG